MSSSESVASSSGFADLPLRPELLATLADLGYAEPTPIQAESIPTLVAGHDLLGQAATGTGKTAAFALPILEHLESNKQHRNPIALVITPTRELALQVSQAFEKYGRQLGARVAVVYGGAPVGPQISALKSGVDIVVATPGRALDHITRKRLVLDDIKTLVLDEADEMMDMGFAEELDAIIEQTPSERQTILFSATMPRRIETIARKYLTDPVRIQIAKPEEIEGAIPQVSQAAYIVNRQHKAAAVARVLDVEAPDAGIIFCRTREQVDGLSETLNAHGYRTEALHGGLSQEQRERVLNKLRTANAQLLIATDVAARGLDIDHLTHVFNYDVPANAETYVHRIGRVGRAGRQGVAITMCEPRDRSMLTTIERTTKRSITVKKVPTLDDVRSARLSKTAAAIREAIADGSAVELKPVLDLLSDDIDLTDIALGAIKLLHGQANTEDNNVPDLLDAREKPQRSGTDKKSSGNGRSRPTGPTAGIFVGAGRNMGIRPGDLVGAIAGETSLSGRQIGDIRIAEKFAIVQVPAASANEVVSALKNTTIKGKRVNVRRDREAR